MRLRTQRELMSEIRARDPQTALTPYALRRMVLAGTIPSVRSGRRYLIDADRLDEYLFAGEKALRKITGIRSIGE